MFLIDDMVDMGLPKNINWPTIEHRIVAKNLLICNPEISDIEKLSKGVINVLNIPKDKIKTITLPELKNYGFQITTSIGV